jgi:hypothetical protein
VQTPPVAKSPASNSAAAVNGDMYQQDGDYIKDIEINDLRNRYTLTKGATQKRVNKLSLLSTDRLGSCLLQSFGTAFLWHATGLESDLCLRISVLRVRAYLIF